MGIEQRPIPEFWNYYLVLEGDVTALSRWVHFDKANFESFSIEIVRLLMATCAEVDVIAKAVCRKIAPDEKPDNIGKYQKVLLESVPLIRRSKVHMPGLRVSRADGPPHPRPWITNEFNYDGLHSGRVLGRLIEMVRSWSRAIPGTAAADTTNTRSGLA